GDDARDGRAARSALRRRAGAVQRSRSHRCGIARQGARRRARGRRGRPRTKAGPGCNAGAARNTQPGSRMMGLTAGEAGLVVDLIFEGIQAVQMARLTPDQQTAALDAMEARVKQEIGETGDAWAQALAARRAALAADAPKA